MSTIKDRVNDLLTGKPPGEWFVIKDDIVNDNHLLRIVALQIAKKSGRKMTTRKINDEIHACFLS